MKENFEPNRILAISVTAQKFGFVVFDGRELLDWGIRAFRSGVNAVKIPLEAKVLLLFDAQQPDLLLLNVAVTKQSKRVAKKIANLASKEAIPVRFIARPEIQKVFAAERESKYHIGATIATYYPELLPHLPSPRKAWQSERHGIRLFEAAALALVYLSEHKTAP